MFKVKNNSFHLEDAKELGTVKKYFSLFPGLGFAAGYKILQRIYKFGGQPYVIDYLHNNHETDFDRYFGPKTGKTMMHATAGRYYIFIRVKFGWDW